MQPSSMTPFRGSLTHYNREDGSGVDYQLTVTSTNRYYAAKEKVLEHPIIPI